MAADLPTLQEWLSRILAEKNRQELEVLLGQTAESDLVGAVYQFSTSEQLALLGMMDAERAGELLLEMNESHLAPLLDKMERKPLARLLYSMEPDDAAFLVDLMEPAKAESVMKGLAAAKRLEVRSLLAHQEETAGRMMDPDVVVVQESQTVADALHSIRAYVAQVDMDEFFSIFVVNRNGVLVGEVPTWKMLLAQPAQKMGEIMTSDVVSVEAHKDQEQVANVVRDHDLVTLPVVDDENKLIGRITVDDVVDVMREEYEEDLGHMAGTGSEEVVAYSIWESIRVRSPWLLFALGGLFGSAMVLNHFRGIIAILPQLAFFVPLVMAMGGNFGIQSSSLVIRGLATGEVKLDHFWRRMGKELAVSFYIGLVFALLLVGGVWLLTGDVQVAMVVGIATSLAVMVASAAGTTIPMALRWLGYDPALATGPFLTTLNDLLGILVYLSVTYLLLF